MSATPSIEEVVGTGLVLALFYRVVSFEAMNRLVPYLVGETRWAELEADPKDMMFSNRAAHVQFMTNMGVQHVLGGTLILFGVVSSQIYLVQLGLLVEWAFQLVDLTQLVSRQGVYTTLKKEWVRPVLLHHFGGLTMTVPIITRGLHQNVHVQTIALTMMLATGFINNSITVLRAVSPESKNFFLTILDAVGVVVTRGLVFPHEGFYLVRDIQSHSQVLAAFAALGVISMCLFNLNMCIPKMKILKNEFASALFPSTTTIASNSSKDGDNKQPVVVTKKLVQRVSSSQLFEGVMKKQM